MYRFLHWCAFSVWWFSVACVLVFALAVVVVRLSLEYITEKPERLSDIVLFLTNYNITIESVDLDWRGAIPVIRTYGVHTDLEFLTFSAAEVELQPRIVESLIHGRVEFAKASASGIALEVFVNRIPEGGDTDINAVIAHISSVLSFGDYSIVESKIVFHQQESRQEVDITQLTSANVFDGLQIDLMASIPGFASNVELITSIDTLPKNLEEIDAQVYVSIDASYDAQSQTMALIPEQLSQVQGNVQLWLDVTQGKPTKIQSVLEDGSVDYDGIRFSGIDTEFIARRYGFAVDVSEDKKPITDSFRQFGLWQALIPEVSFTYEKKQFDYTKLFVQQQQDSQLWFSLEQGEAGLFMPLFSSFMPDWVQQLQLWQTSGVLHNIYGSIPLQDPLAVTAWGQISALDIGSPRNTILQVQVPAASFAIASRQASITVAQTKPMSLQVGQAFEHAFVFDSGYFNLQVDWKESGSLRLYGEDMFARMGGVSLLADIEYRYDFLTPSLSNFLIGLTFNNAPAAKKDQFIPYVVLPSEAVDVLADNISADGLFSGNFLLYLAVGADDEPVEITYSLDIQGSGSNRITYVGFPEIIDFVGNIYVDTFGLEVQSDSLQVVESLVQDVQFHMGGNYDVIHIKGTTTNNLPQLQKLITAYDVGIDSSLPRDIYANGKVRVDFDFEFSRKISDNQPVDNVIDLQVSLIDNNIFHGDYRDLPITNINGSFFYHQGKISQEKPFTANFAGKDLTFGASNIHVDENPILRFTATFALPGVLLNRLFALPSPIAQGTGEADVLLDFHADSYEFTRAIVKSQLEGLSFDIPLGIGKSREERIESFFVMEKFDDETYVHLQLKDRIKGMVVLDVNNTPRGWVGIGEASKKPIPVREEALSIVASYDVIDIQELLDWFNDNKLEQVIETDQSLTKGTLINSLPEAEHSSDTGTTILTILEGTDIEFSANSIGANNFFVNQANGTLHKDGDEWIIDISSDLLSSKIKVSRDGEVQKIIVDKLVIAEYKSIANHDDEPTSSVKKAQDWSDPLAAFDPRIPNPIQFVVKRLVYDGNDYGYWSMNLDPDSQGLRLNDLVAVKDNVTAKGSAFWKYDAHAEEGEQQFTTAHLAITGTDIENMADVLTSKKAFFQTSLAWKASPIAISPENVKGSVNIALQEGSIDTNQDSIALLNLIGLLNIETIGKRLSLNFSDQGGNIAFDVAKGQLELGDGLVKTTNPFILKGSAIDIELQGTADIVNNVVDQTMIVKIPIGETLPLATVLAGFAPQVSVVLLILNYALQKPFTKFTSARFTMTGSFDDPQLVLDKLFNVDLDETNGAAPISTETQ